MAKIIDFQQNNSKKWKKFEEFTHNNKIKTWANLPTMGDS